MLVLKDKFIGKSVLSLRTGGVVANITAPIINPNNLKIEGFYCDDHFSKGSLVLLSQDIRDQLPQGVVVNDHEVLADPEELVRLKPVMDIGFDLIGKPVVTDKKRRMGKVNDYALDEQTLYVQKLYVTGGLIKSLSSGSLSVDRNQILEISNRRITIKDPEQPVKSRSTANAPIPAV